MSSRDLNRPPPLDAEYVVGEMYEFKPEDDKVIHVPAPSYGIYSHTRGAGGLDD